MEKLKRNTILILIAFVCNFLLNQFAEEFRFVPKLRWIYEYGGFGSVLILLILLLLSLLNGIFILKEVKTKLSTRIFWSPLCMSVLIYFIIMIFIILIFY